MHSRNDLAITMEDIEYGSKFICASTHSEEGMRHMFTYGNVYTFKFRSTKEVFDYRREMHKEIRTFVFEKETTDGTKSRDIEAQADYFIERHSVTSNCYIRKVRLTPVLIPMSKLSDEDLFLIRMGGEIDPHLDSSL